MVLDLAFAALFTFCIYHLFCSVSDVYEIL